MFICGPVFLSPSEPFRVLPPEFWIFQPCCCDARGAYIGRVFFSRVMLPFCLISHLENFIQPMVENGFHSPLFWKSQWAHFLCVKLLARHKPRDWASYRNEEKLRQNSKGGEHCENLEERFQPKVQQLEILTGKEKGQSKRNGKIGNLVEESLRMTECGKNPAEPRSFTIGGV